VPTEQLLIAWVGPEPFGRFLDDLPQRLYRCLAVTVRQYETGAQQRVGRQPVAAPYVAQRLPYRRRKVGWDNTTTGSDGDTGAAASSPIRSRSNISRSQASRGIRRKSRANSPNLRPPIVKSEPGTRRISKKEK
jgi:hypothetical protein